MRKILSAFLGFYFILAAFNVRALEIKRETAFSLAFPGQTGLIDYRKYGKIKKPNTAQCHFVLTKPEALKQIVGEGIFPNEDGVKRDPAYLLYARKRELEGSHWNFTEDKNLQKAFFKWATANEDPGVKMFYVAGILERAGLIRHAIKAYYSVVLNFPLTIGWAETGAFYYFLGPGALAKCYELSRNHPELGIKLKDAKLTIIKKDGVTMDPRKFVPSQWDIVINPGYWEKDSRYDKVIKFKKENPDKSIKLADMGTSIIKYFPNENARVRIVEFNNGDFQMQVNKKPFFIKAVAYSCTKVGEGPDVQTKTLYRDRNKNGLVDGLFDSWVDFNRNNKRDLAEKKNIGDASLLRAMGANAIRIYHNDGDPKPKATIRKLYKDYGIYTILGNFMGMYAVDSGATWDPGTDYSDQEQLAKIRRSVLAMVQQYKDEDGVLLWMLGNENNYDYGAQVHKNPIAYYKFVNVIAKEIHEMDPTRPVAICNGDVEFIEKIAKYAPEIDIVGANSYQGASGFGGLWFTVKSVANRPALITEYGVDAYWEGKGVDEEAQMEYHKGNWENIMANRAGFGIGNAIGGVAFEWMDEWWKHDQDKKEKFFIHATHGSWQGPQPDGWMHEEWLGLVGQGNGKHSPYMRELRKVYLYYRNVWRQKIWQ